MDQNIKLRQIYWLIVFSVKKYMKWFVVISSTVGDNAATIINSYMEELIVTNYMDERVTKG